MLSLSATAAVAAALAAYRDRVRANEAAAASTLDTLASWWGELTGLDTAQAGVRTSAKGDRTLLAAYEAKAARITADGEAAELVRAVAAELDRPDLAAQAASLTVGGAVREVGGATVRDLADVAQDVGAGWIAALKASPYLVAGLALVVAWSWLGKKK
ncbi:MAG: hypothetical protein IPO09_18985 [Anaeromyxobacter sp.]|nr:hypothetical protein [Anaeromyxobacter sp.]MBL0276017.1 hypothetical protein [Anaeromyxobacter sp.]